MHALPRIASRTLPPRDGELLLTAADVRTQLFEYSSNSAMRSGKTLSVALVHPRKGFERVG